MISRHRHIVAVPPTMVLVIASLLGGWTHTPLIGTTIASSRTIFGGAGIQEVKMGDAHLTGWSGFFFAQQSREHVSVAALTSPVLVRTNDTSILIPIGWQWNTGQPLSRIPDHFLERYLKDTLPNDTAVLPHAFTNKDAWLVASVHPNVRDEVWVMSAPAGVDNEETVLRLMAFPQSDTLPRAASAFTVERWTIAVREFLEKNDDPVLFLDAFVPHIVSMIEWFGNAGYPERASRYKGALDNLANEFKVFLSKDAKGLIRALESDHSRRSAGVMVSPVEPRMTPVSPFDRAQGDTNTEVEPFDAAFVKQQAYLLLRDMGVLFTINTEIVPIDASSAEVHAIVFGDHTFDFVIDIDRQVIDAIAMDGKMMAYPMGVGEFKSWVEGLEFEI